MADDWYRVTPGLLAGKYPGARLGELLEAGVRGFVDLTEDGELLPYAELLPTGVAHHRIAVPDVTCPSTEQVRTALDIIEAAAAEGVVYIHCRGGCGRTGVVIGCYLVEQGLDADQALACVHELTRALWSTPCPETGEQTEMVMRWGRQGPPSRAPRVPSRGRRSGSW